MDRIALVRRMNQLGVSDDQVAFALQTDKESFYRHLTYKVPLISLWEAEQLIKLLKMDDRMAMSIIFGIPPEETPTRPEAMRLVKIFCRQMRAHGYEMKWITQRDENGSWHWTIKMDEETQGV